MNLGWRLIESEGRDVIEGRWREWIARVYPNDGGIAVPFDVWRKPVGSGYHQYGAVHEDLKLAITTCENVIRDAEGLGLPTDEPVDLGRARDDIATLETRLQEARALIAEQALQIRRLSR